MDDLTNAMRTIVEAVTCLQGCKAVELLCHPEIVSLIKDGVDPITLLERAVTDGFLVEIEYVLPAIDYKIKSFYLPAGTSIRVNKLGSSGVAP